MLAGLGAGLTEAVFAVTPSETIKYVPGRMRMIPSPSIVFSSTFTFLLSDLAVLGGRMKAEWKMVMFHTWSSEMG